MNKVNILLRHNCITVKPASLYRSSGPEALATVMMNLAYYGKALSQEAFDAIQKLSPVDLVDWWTEVETELKEISGANRKIEKFVVYKNFPAEVLKKSEADYWIPQILMYWGFPSHYFTEKVEPRIKMVEKKSPTVLRLVNDSELKKIFDAYIASPARWKDQEFTDVKFLVDSFADTINVAAFGFKENLIMLASFMINNHKKLQISTATDVLRLAVGLSNGDVSLREKSKFISFKKPVRKYLLSLLENSRNIEEDVARRPEIWKKLFHQLHPGDYKNHFPNVCKVMNKSFKNDLSTWNSKVEQMLLKKDENVLDILSERPGDFRRRLVHATDLFGNKAVVAFTNPKVLNKLTTYQLVSLRSYLETLNCRFNRVFPPKGNWNKLQIGEARWINETCVNALCVALTNALGEKVPQVKILDENLKMVKLPNDGEVSPYSRGTRFPIPENIDFIRTASYWKNSGSTVWFDNGWNFFDSDWVPLGACSWTEVNYKKGAAVFSGDPVNSLEMKGRAAQMIDLYPSKLLKEGVRYALWSVLCYSNVPFANAEDVFAALQWGENAQSGKLFEPSRCQLSFPLKGKGKTKFVCVVDLLTREMIYIDANLYGKVNTASANGISLQTNMPPFMEYIESLPSVYDLFRQSVSDKSNIHVLYSDKNTSLDDEMAYVFKPENKLNKFKALDLNSILK